MTNQKSSSSQNLDHLSAAAFAVALVIALGLYFMIYLPAIREGVASDVLLAKEILWLEIHIAVYWISYALYFTGFLLAVVCFLRRATTRFPWLEIATSLATALAIIGLMTGVLFSKPAWNAWWVWDAKHVFVLFNTFILLGISPPVALQRLFLDKSHRNLLSVVLLFIAVAICVGSLLIGFMRNVHPQWFLRLLFP
ncbi:MAG TPA: cytochrome c biogenesis protein CcsA [Anaerolineales bacterium]|nr:cytochrome c biogenesis protein CcsA [Anaerolineales bacterium]